VNRPDRQTAPKTVLICEDDPNLRTLVRLALGDGFRFLEAPDAPTVLELVRRSKPDLIVLDLMLPGKNGLELLADIRRAEDGARTPVVVISAWSDSDAAAREAGADRFVAKPFEPDALRATVVELLCGHGE
jgi:DNA-binding response OmpR family regulator